MNEVLTVRVYGIPAGQPRARAFARPMGGGKFSARLYDPGTAEAWKGEIALAFKGCIPAMPIDVPCRLDATFLFPRPQRLLKKKSPAGRVPHATKPDRDNADKALMDALTRMGFWTDDNLVWTGTITKVYVAIGERPGAEIRIETYSNDPATLPTVAGTPAPAAVPSAGAI